VSLAHTNITLYMQGQSSNAEHRTLINQAYKQY